MDSNSPRTRGIVVVLIVAVLFFVFGLATASGCQSTDSTSGSIVVDTTQTVVDSTRTLGDSLTIY